jgi:hypothetical protein
MGAVRRTAERLDERSRDCNASELLRQLGTRTVAAVSGLRVTIHPDGVTLPVHAGYRVTIHLAANDTYTVRRVFERGGRRWVKGEEVGVYCDQVSDAAYRASCYVNVPFGAHAAR